MKNQLIGLLLFFTLSTSGQSDLHKIPNDSLYQYLFQDDDAIRNENFRNALKRDKMERVEPLKVFAVYLASIVCGGLGDGLNDSGHKTAGHLWNAASIGILLVSPKIIHYQANKWWKYPVEYAGIRFWAFDGVYNRTRSLPLNYIGSTSITDRFYTKIGGQMSFLKILAIGFTIKFPIDQLYHVK